MFWILNRLRGGGFRKDIDLPWVWINGLVLYVLFFSIDKNIYYSIAILILYVLGESYGWGVWAGAMGYDEPAKELMMNGSQEEARHTGIRQIADFLIGPKKYGWFNAALALAIRGFYWFAPLLLIVFFRGHIGVSTLVAALFILSFGFPLSFTFARMSSMYGGINRSEFKTAWEQGEVWYGAMQDLVLLLIVLDVCCG